MRAFLTGPGGSWFSSELVGRAEEIYGARRNPEAWQHLQGLQLYHDQVADIANLVGQALLAWKADPSAIEKALAISLPAAPEPQR